MSAYRIPFNKPCRTGAEQTYIAEAMAVGHLAGDGPFTKRCHALLEHEVGVPKALLTTSCTHALEMAALLLDIAPGDEVIVPSFTFVSTVNAFVLRGAQPGLRRRSARYAEPRRGAARSADHAAHEGDRRRSTTPASAARWTRSWRVAERHGVAVIEDNAHGLFGDYKRPQPRARSARWRPRASTRRRTSPAARAGRC